MTARTLSAMIAAAALTAGATTALAQQRTLTGTVESGLRGSQREARQEAESMGLREANRACAMHRAGETLEAGTESRVNCDSAGGVFNEAQYRCEVIWYARCAGTAPPAGTQQAESAAEGAAEGTGDDTGSHCAATINAAASMFGIALRINGAGVCSGEGATPQ